MEWLRSLLDNSSTPVFTALLLGLLTAVSPCPLATNIAAIGFISKDIDNRHRVFLNGVLYTSGRIIAYTILGIILISFIREGAGIFGLQKSVSKWGEMIVGPAMLLFGGWMLFGNHINLPSFGYNGSGEFLAKKGGPGALYLGILFALAFCPSSAIFYFGMLIPMAVNVGYGWLLPVAFALATAIPVLVVAWTIAFSVEHIGAFYGRIKAFQKWLNYVVGILFIIIGIYYCIMIYI